MFHFVNGTDGIADLRVSPPGFRAGLLALSVLFLGLSITASGGAEDRHRVVMMISRGDPRAMQAVDAVNGHLADLPVDLTIEDVPAASRDLRVVNRLARDLASNSGAQTVFWVDISDPDQVFLYISTPEGGKTLVRSIDSENETFETRLDAMAVIVRASLQGIVQGGGNRCGGSAPKG